MSSAPQESHPPRVRVVLVDDHQVVRVGLKTLLERSSKIQVVGEASTVEGAVEQATRHTPDVVVLDVRLPDGSGVDACRRIRQLPGACRVLILTSYADDDTIFKCISAGADGYLLKEIDGTRLIHSIEQIAAGQSILDPAVTRVVLGHIKDQPAREPQDRMDLLSAQERRVLAKVADGKTNKEIAVELGLSDKTVKNYLSNLMEKLEINRRSQAAALFVQNSKNLTSAAHDSESAARRSASV